MRNLIDRMYVKNSDNLFKTVNKFEYEVRDLTTKKDIATLFIRMQKIVEALEENDIKVDMPTVEETEELIDKLVEEDRAQVNNDIADSLFEARQDAKTSETGIINKIKYYIDEAKIRFGSLDDNIKNYYKANIDALSEEDFSAVLDEILAEK